MYKDKQILPENWSTEMPAGILYVNFNHRGTKLEGICDQANTRAEKDKMVF